MHIGLISEHASPLATGVGGVDSGGQNVYVDQVARALVRRGHSVDVFTRRDDERLPRFVDVRPGLRVWHVSAGPPRAIAKEALLPYMHEFAHHARHIIETHGTYDVLHANFFMSGWVASHLRRVFGTPYAITFHALGRVRRMHQGAADAFPPERELIEQHLAQQADCVVAECPQDAHDLQCLYGASGERIVTIPCGFNPQEFAPQNAMTARQLCDIDPNAFVILQLGRLVPRKGIDTVIHALGLLQYLTSREVRLLIVGGEADTACERATPEIGRLRAIARHCGVSDLVTFTGRRDRQMLRRYYSASDVFVSTPWYEPFGITPLEAMACGVPVVGSRVGGIQSTVVDGTTGFLVPPRDSLSLARALSVLAENPAMARAMGRAGIARVRSHYTWDRVATQLEGALRDIAHPRTRPRDDAVPSMSTLSP